MQAGVLRFASLIGQSGGDHRRLERAHNVVMTSDAPAGRREHEAKLTLWAGELPLAQNIEHERADRHRAVASLRFRPAYLIVAIGALAHVQFTALEIDVLPAQTTKFRRAQPVKIAVSSSGRQRPAAAMIALISSEVGMSTPTFNLPSRRLSASIFLTPKATFWATLPRRCARVAAT